MSENIPAVTWGYSTELNITATAKGISDTLNPLFSSVTFTSGTTSDPVNGLSTETVTYNLNQKIDGNAIKISGRAAFENLSVEVAGVKTNFGDISTGTIDMSPVPDLPIYFDAILITSPKLSLESHSELYTISKFSLLRTIVA